MKPNVGRKMCDFIVLKVNEGVNTNILAAFSTRAETHTALRFALRIYSLYGYRLFMFLCIF